MPVDHDTVRRVARLARIAITDAELPALAAQLNGILDFVAQLAEVDVTAVEPTTTAVVAHLKMRDDLLTEAGNADAIVSNAPVTADHFFAVPKVVE